MCVYFVLKSKPLFWNKSSSLLVHSQDAVGSGSITQATLWWKARVTSSYFSTRVFPHKKLSFAAFPWKLCDKLEGKPFKVHFVVHCSVWRHRCFVSFYITSDHRLHQEEHLIFPPMRTTTLCPRKYWIFYKYIRPVKKSVSNGVHKHLNYIKTKYLKSIHLYPCFTCMWFYKSNPN